MSNHPVTLTLPSDEDASLIVNALRARATDVRSASQGAADNLASIARGRPSVGRLIEMGLQAISDEAHDLDYLAETIEQQSTPQGQDEATGRRQ